MTNFKEKHMQAKKELFQECLKLLESATWSSGLIEEAEEKCKMKPGYADILFPSGLGQVVVEFQGWLDDLMLEALDKKDKPKKIREQIALALEIRIMKVISKNAALNNGSFFVIPTNILAGNEAACHTCDLIWKYAGDKSTDFNYYTKRGLLLPVYLSTKAFYLADNSKNHQDTKLFIKNSLDNIINIASFKGRINLPKIEDIPILRLFS